MITPRCFTPEWIAQQRGSLGRIDPGILEKSIFALALLGHLVESGIPFVFKGGTSLLLHLNPIRRLSIDIDIFCSASKNDLNEALGRIAGLPPFDGYEEDERGQRGLPNRRHFKFFYISPTQRAARLFILLDVVEESTCPVDTIQKVIRTPFIEVERDVLVTLPTLEGLLGDKLTAFAPRSTGVPFQPANGQPCDTMQVVKQLFDVAALFDAMQDLPAAARAYEAVLALENGYRGSSFSREHTLTDTRDACVALSMHTLRGVPENPDAVLLHDGMKKLASHLTQARFNKDDARVACGKIALLTTLLMHDRTDVDVATLRFNGAPESLDGLNALRIVEPNWQPLIRLRPANPEAFFYFQWVDAIEQGRQ